MFTNLNTLRQIKPISDVIDKSDIDAQRFTVELNDWIHGFGSLGYDEAETLSLEIATKYTVDAAMQLLEDIREAREIQEDDIEYRMVEEIPTGLLKKLSTEVGGSLCSLHSHDGTNICAFRGQEAVGYVSGKEFNNRFAVRGYYVEKGFRNKKIGRGLLNQLLDISELKGFKGIGFDNASIQGQVALGKFGDYLERQGNIQYEYSTHGDDGGS